MAFTERMKLLRSSPYEYAGSDFAVHRDIASFAFNHMAGVFLKHPDLGTRPDLEDVHLLNPLIVPAIDIGNPCGLPCVELC